MNSKTSYQILSNPQRLHHAESHACPIGWLKFRKFDGISAIWIPSDRRLYSIEGNDLHAPEWFLSAFPSFSVHGELWNPSTDSQYDVKWKWDQLKFVAFAFPDHSTWKEGRREIEGNDIIMVPMEVEDLDPQWEGLVFQNPQAKYGGRSRDVLKFKPTYDEEGIVVGCKGDALLVEYVLTEKSETIHGYSDSLPSKITVSVKVGGGNGIFGNGVYPKGTKIRFTFLGFAKGNLQSAIMKEVIK